MSDPYRRRAIKMIAGGMVGAGLMASSGGGFAVASGSKTIKIKTNTRVPLIPELAQVMPAAPNLMNQLATEFAPAAAQLKTEKAYWLGLNGWTTDRLSGPIMEGKVSLENLGEQAWAVYASSYWGGMELRKHWGMPKAIQELGMKMEPPFAQVQQGILATLKKRLDALEEGPDACLALLPEIMREESTSGTVHGIAYNAGVQVVKTEDPPLGQRRPHREPKPSVVRIYPRHFMRVDYDLPTPHYLKFWRSAFERAVASNPEGYEKAITGGPGQTNLRDIWQKAVMYGNTTWGGDAQDHWSDAYFEETIHWSSVLTFGMEAVGLAALAAVINKDPDAAYLAVMGNALYVGATPGWLLGPLHTEGQLPTVVS